MRLESQHFRARRNTTHARSSTSYAPPEKARRRHGNRHAFRLNAHGQVVTFVPQRISPIVGINTPLTRTLCVVGIVLFHTKTSQSPAQTRRNALLPFATRGIHRPKKMGNVTADSTYVTTSSRRPGPTEDSKRPFDCAVAAQSTLVS